MITYIRGILEGMSAVSDMESTWQEPQWAGFRLLEKK